MLTRIVLTRKTGQLGNRLMVAAHVLAAAWERGAVCLNPAFAEYSDGFEGPRRCLATWAETWAGGPERTWAPWQRSLAYGATRAVWQVGKVARFASGGRLALARSRNAAPKDLRAVVEAAESGGARTLLLQGYHFRHAPWAERHAEGLRRFLRPVAEHRAPAEAALTALRARCEVVVGVHLRHGDYRTHLGGRFFWEVPTYLGFIRRMAGLLAPRRVGFLVCSNARHGADDFAGLVWAPGPGSVLGDLHALSLCDYVLGPPSSFSSWAAFHGAARLLRIEDAAHPFTLDDFAVQTAPETRW